MVKENIDDENDKNRQKEWILNTFGCDDLEPHNRSLECWMMSVRRLMSGANPDNTMRNPSRFVCPGHPEHRTEFPFTFARAQRV